MARDVAPGTTKTAARAELARRAALLARMREYLDRQGVLEVRTPALVASPASEPALANLALARERAPRFLRTSPEAALKGLLAAGAGDLYELGPAWRAEEHGRRHREEFTLLEWYRVGFDHHALMDDVAGLLAACGYPGRPQRVSYAALFAEVLACDPHRASTGELAALARRAVGSVPGVDEGDRAMLLELLFGFALEPALAGRGAVFVYDFPAPLRAYARLAGGVPPHAERFELVIDGVEIANGYHEIVDACEQAACFAEENALRARRGLPATALDDGWLAALERGLPACAGVALGVERLAMALAGSKTLAAFHEIFENA